MCKFSESLRKYKEAVYSVGVECFSQTFTRFAKKFFKYTKGGESDMIFSLITAGTITAAQLFAQGVTTSVVAYSIAKTGKKVRVRL